MKILLPKLPYASDALEPYIGGFTIETHHDKHHKAYVDNTIILTKGTDLEGKDLETIIMKTAGDASRTGIFNNAAQAWNHEFYWQCMKPNGGGDPYGKAKELIIKSFGSVDNFSNQLIQAGRTQFGSGWVWLVSRGDQLVITKTGNANLPLPDGAKPIITIDVWEHAYYLDYQNKRPEYLSVFMQNLINWDFANSRL